MIERIKFWLMGWRRQPFWYRQNTGEHYAFQGYNLFTDMVTYREGQFGHSDITLYYPEMSRVEWLDIGNLPGWRDLKKDRPPQHINCRCVS